MSFGHQNPGPGNDLCLPRLRISGRRLPFKIAAPTKQSPLHQWKFSKMYNIPRFAHGFGSSLCIRLSNKIVQAISRSHVISWKWTWSRYRTRLSQRKCMRLQLGGVQYNFLYDYCVREKIGDLRTWTHHLYNAHGKFFSYMLYVRFVHFAKGPTYS
jgi:hypothetical protein